MKEKFKLKPIYLIISIILIILLVLLGTTLNKKEETEKFLIKQEEAEKIAYNELFELLETFNTENYAAVKEVYLPYQEMEKEGFGREAHAKFIQDFGLYTPYILEGILNVEQVDKHTIVGEAFFKDNSVNVNYFEEYEQGYQNFGVQNLVKFEIIKKDGKMIISKFKVVETHTFEDFKDYPVFEEKLKSILPNGNLNELQNFN